VARVYKLGTCNDCGSLLSCSDLVRTERQMMNTVALCVLNRVLFDIELDQYCFMTTILVSISSSFVSTRR
jgi:hypothetical protein